MSLGGGTFITQNKVLPGSYHNFVSAASASPALSDRGLVAAPIQLSWGPENELYEVDTADVQKNALKIFGYPYTAAELRDVRELFRNAVKVFFYRLNGGGTKASITTGNLTGTAKYGGTRGNDLKIVIAANVNEPAKWDVTSYLGTEKVDQQLAVANADAVVDNDFIIFSGTGVLAATAGATLTGGTDITVTGTQHVAFLDKSEAFGFNTVPCPTTDSTTIALYEAHAKRRRDENGVKFQVVVYRKAADYEGVINVENTVTDAGANAAALVYWTAGAEAAAPSNKSTTNKTYDGEYTVDTNYTQTQLETNLKAGKFMFHKVGQEVRVLDDVNSLTTFTAEKSSDFQNNQVIRVLDQIGNDIALMFNTKYLGKIQNNKSGRSAFWADVVTYHKELERIQAIEDFSSDDVTVEQGVDKKSVVVECPVTPVSAMTKLYMTTVVQ